MNSSTTLTQPVWDNEPDRGLPTFKWLLMLSVLVLVLPVLGGLLLYLDGPPALKVSHTAADLSSSSSDQSIRELAIQVDRWVVKVTVVTTLGGIGLLLAMAVALCKWRAAWRQRLAACAKETQSQRLAACVRESQKTDGELHGELAVARKTEEELRRIPVELEKRAATLEERLASLSRAHAVLEEELNKRKRTEKTMSQQRQELERSKDVLELHVQARTQELQKLQRRYELILNSAGEGICGLDLEGKTTFVNPAAARMTGWNIEELIGKSEQEVFCRTESNGHHVDGANNGEYLANQIFYRQDGSSFAVEAVRTPIKEQERMVGSVLIFKDITERKQTEEQLSQKADELIRSNAELEQFAFVASHDLQEPLRKIQAFGDRLKVKCEGALQTEGRDYLERMQNAAARMQKLIDDLLTFSRVIRASQPFVTVDLSAVAAEVLGDLEVRIEKTKAQVEVGKLPAIDADPMQIRQLLQNLISNALKFQPPGAVPAIKIHAEIINRQPDRGDTIFLSRHQTTDGNPANSIEICELRVQDNGIGFDEKYLDKIFAVFQRLHGRQEYEGTGVGLAVCRRIVDRHSGTITAKSSPGNGSTFLITLPVHQSRTENPT